MSTSRITLPMLRDVASKRIVFGHQSVGNNIIEGLSLIMSGFSDNPMRLVLGYEIANFEKPVFAHFLVGTNGDAIAKILAFKKVLQDGVGDKVDVAFFKFCFVDIDSKTDLKKVFKVYVNTFDELSAAFPRVTFLHCTVPLTSVQTGVKPWIYKLLGKELWGERDNVKREEFNTLLRTHYGNRVFDLAYFESSTHSISRVTGMLKGQRYYSLNSVYTYDGGHLNDVGKQIIAEKLVEFLYGQFNAK